MGWRLGAQQQVRERLCPLTYFNAITRPVGIQLPLYWRVYCRGQPRDFPPDLEALAHLLAICWGGEPVAAGTEVRRNRAIRREVVLGVPGGLEPLRRLFPLPRGVDTPV